MFAILATLTASAAALELSALRRQGGGPTYPVEPPAVPGLRELLPIVHDGMDRSYYIYIPTTLNVSQSTPVVLNLHCFTCVPEDQLAFSYMELVAEEGPFIVATPTGFGRSWNAGPSCCAPAYPRIDDVGFLQAVVDDVARRYTVDRRRVYSVGFSNGAAMTYRLACDASTVFAAVATMAGYDPWNAPGIPEYCNLQRQVPLIYFVGTADPFVPMDSASQNIADWVTINNCRNNAQPGFARGVTQCSYYTDCDLVSQPLNITVCISEGEPHFYWPGSSAYPQGNMDLDASREIWRFLSQYAL
eukprot:TRINITY_DN19335_c0_g1_i1.p1 TRINITY_DN19335_c0_g1~~TRINITY_DN19335_c0_g1_i1.p1  ORF type:complete len:302 (+),score=47.80 TRINITY_DN19335_c0_g1_i1:41-946(+)